MLAKGTEANSPHPAFNIDRAALTLVDSVAWQQEASRPLLLLVLVLLLLLPPSLYLDLITKLFSKCFFRFAHFGRIPPPPEKRGKSRLTPNSVAHK